MTDDRDGPRGNGGPLNDDAAAKLWGHVRAFEVLDAQMQEIRDDVAARKDLAKADGFDNNILQVILKRRKVGAGQTREADNLVKLYEEALIEQGALPLEETNRLSRQPEDRRSPDEIAESLHGAALDPAAELRRLAAKMGATISMRVGDEEIVIAGAGEGVTP